MATRKKAAANNEEVVARTWTHLIEELYASSWDEGIQRYRSPYVFRGLSNRAWDLSTSLARMGAPAGELSKLEGHLLRNFRKYAHNDVPTADSIWVWLALAQHHGLPTRLLDWTYSPFVALHFATADLRDATCDAVVWCVNHLEAHALLPRKLRQLSDQGSIVFTVEMLDRAAGSLAEFDKLSSNDFVVFLEPPSLDARIVNQFALFSLISDPGARLDHWLEAHPHLYRRIIIPAKLKRQVRDMLDQANITERMLFPGLDGLSQWLARYYQPPADDATAPPADSSR